MSTATTSAPSAASAWEASELGSRVSARVAATAVRDESGKREYIGAVIDVTAAKHAEDERSATRALQLANERLQLALRGSNVGIFDFDLREASIERAVDAFPDAADIYERNQERKESERKPDRKKRGV